MNVGDFLGRVSCVEEEGQQKQQGCAPVIPDDVQFQLSNK